MKNWLILKKIPLTLSWVGTNRTPTSITSSKSTKCGKKGSREHSQQLEMRNGTRASASPQLTGNRENVAYSLMHSLLSSSSSINHQVATSPSLCGYQSITFCNAARSWSRSWEAEYIIQRITTITEWGVAFWRMAWFVWKRFVRHLGLFTVFAFTHPMMRRDVQ